MKLKIAGVWKKVIPRVKMDGGWKDAQRVFVNRGGTWHTASEPGDPVLIDAVASLTWNYVYGPRLGYIEGYDDGSSLVPETMDLYNPSKKVVNLEYGSNDYTTNRGGPWRWFTFVFDGAIGEIPFPPLAKFGDYVLHYDSEVATTVPTTNRVWYRCYSDLPQDTVPRTFKM